jgi:hypothetical protein
VEDLVGNRRDVLGNRRREPTEPIPNWQRGFDRERSISETLDISGDEHRDVACQKGIIRIIGDIDFDGFPWRLFRFFSAAILGIFASASTSRLAGSYGSSELRLLSSTRKVNL